MSHHSDHAAEHTPEAIRKRITGSTPQDFLKDSIYGSIDGAITTFAVVSSVAGAGLPSAIVIIMGAANLLADGFSMASANFLGTRADNQAAAKARREEEYEIEFHPEGEREEVRQIFAAKGFDGETLDKIVEVITANRELWLETMLLEEHGITSEQPAPWKAALATFIAFLLIGAIPLIAYFIDFFDPGSIGNPFSSACVLTAISFAIIGGIKARIVGQKTWTGTCETLAIGALASGLAYLTGFLLRPLAG